MPIPDEENEPKKNKEKTNKKGKLFVIAMILIVVGTAIGAIAYVTIVPNESIIKNTTNSTTSPEKNITNNQTISPKEGYSLIKLANLNFFVTKNCGEKYKKGDYFDSYSGGKDYHTDYEHQAPWEKGPINNSQIMIQNDTNGSYESFWLEISNIGNSSIIDGINYKNNDTNQDISYETVDVDGNNVTLIYTGENFSSQNIGANASIACIEYEGKLVVMIWEGSPVDMYIIESFFKLNN